MRGHAGVRPGIWIVAALVAVASGCAELDKTKDQSAAGRASVQLVFARVPAEKAADLDGVWDGTEPIAMAAQHRQHLEANGFRLGQVSGAPPAPLSGWLEERDPRLMIGPVVHMPPGFRLVAKPLGESGSRTIMYRDRSGSVGGRDFPNARAVLAIRCLAVAPGSARLRLVPEVQWRRGDPPVATPGLLRRRRFHGQVHRYDDLAWEVTVARGTWLVVGCDPRRTLSVAGQIMLAQRQAQRYVSLLLVQVGPGLAPVARTRPTRRP